jgi:hypothetical protein
MEEIAKKAYETYCQAKTTMSKGAAVLMWELLSPEDRFAWQCAVSLVYVHGFEDAKKG